MTAPNPTAVSPAFVAWLKGEETGQDAHGRPLPHGSPALAAYLCPAGKWTIGWGSTGADIGRGTTWTAWDCSVRLARDLAEVQAGVTRALRGTPTTQGQFDGLCGFAYNLGVGALAGSVLLKRHLLHDYAGAAAQFGAWDHAHVGGQFVRLAGLTARRAAEAAFYRGDG